mmetsp:Transcript_123577/g.242459  ORF Transcript_123577/g.242459 Transcript_123577/m.242459 type:complete len:258 (+) Transcript_123577:96-869(+)
MAAALPDGWAQHQDGEGRPFYYNAATEESTYDLPGEPAGVGGDLPAGWTQHQDAEGRTYYANSVTGESSWEVPAVAAASSAARGDGGANSTWSLENTFGLGPAGSERLFEGKVRLLDRSYTSVSSTIDALCSGALVVEEGLCVMYSESRSLYYLLWRDDKADAAQEVFCVWSEEQAVCLGPVGNEHVFEGKAELLPKDVYRSVRQTIDALNMGHIAPEFGFCVVFSDTQQLYFLVYRTDKEAEATGMFPEWRRTGEE